MNDSQITSDVNAIFDSGLTESATHTYGGSTETLTVFFDEPYDSSSVFNVGMENALPRIQIKTSDMTNVTMSSTFTINSTVYNVKEIHNDNYGVTQISLTEDE